MSANLERIESAPGYMAGHSSAAEYSLRWSDRQDAADANAAHDFWLACLAGDATAPAVWAPTVGDYSTPYREGVPQPQRIPALHEVLTNSLDYPNGPTVAEVMQILLNVASGYDVLGTPEQARALLARMARTWSKFNAMEVD